MSDYIYQCPSPTVRTVTPDACVHEFNHLSINANHPDLNDSMDDQVPDSSITNCESLVSTDQFGTVLLSFISSGFTELNEGDKAQRYIKERFVSRVAMLGTQVTVVAIHHNCHSTVLAKLSTGPSFQVYSRAVQKKGGGNTGNVGYAWHVTLKEEVSKISSYGFAYSRKPESNGLYGCGGLFCSCQSSSRKAPEFSCKITFAKWYDNEDMLIQRISILPL
ncbi:uncharacterized protein J3R85_017073 [Psidium guajava]|nr:uncharacterized protein J3R85_017073 [Psidium guajava]